MPFSATIFGAPMLGRQSGAAGERDREGRIVGQRSALVKPQVRASWSWDGVGLESTITLQGCKVQESGLGKGEVHHSSLVPSPFLPRALLGEPPQTDPITGPQPPALPLPPQCSSRMTKDDQDLSFLPAPFQHPHWLCLSPVSDSHSIFVTCLLFTFFCPRTL